MAGNQRRMRSRGYVFLLSVGSRPDKHFKLESIYDSLHNSIQSFFLVKEIGGITVVGSIEHYDDFFAGIAPENVIRTFRFCANP